MPERRFDTWRTWRRPRIHHLALDEARGVIWAATDEGLLRWDVATGRETRLAPPQASFEGPIGTVALDGDGNVWLAPRQQYGPADLDATTGVLRLAPDGGWTRFTTVDGLAGDAVYRIVADADGSVWFGTVAGLSRLSVDGLWTTYLNPNAYQTGCQGYACRRVVLDLEPDGHGGVWYINPDGLSHVDGGGRWYESAQDACGLAVNSDGNVWYSYCGGGYVVLADAGDFLGGGYTNNWGLNEIGDLVVDAADNLWVAGNSAVGRRKPDGSWQVWNLATVDAQALVLNSAGQPWVGSAGNVARLNDDGSWFSLPAGIPLAGDSVQALAFGPQGRLWLGTDPDSAARGPITERGPDGQWRSHALARSHGVDTLAVDAMGRAWATTGGSIVRLDTGGERQEWPVETFVPDDSKGYIHGLAFDGWGSTWFGLPANDVPAGGVIELYPGGSWRRHTTADGLASDSVWSLTYHSARARLWAAGEGELSVREPDGRWRSLVTPSELRNRIVWAVQVDASGNLWVATDGAGLWRLDAAGGWSAEPDGEGGALSIVRALDVDQDGNLWAASYQGLARRRPDGVWSWFIPPGDGPYWRFVNTVRVDRRGSVWIGTREGLAQLW